MDRIEQKFIVQLMSSLVSFAIRIIGRSQFAAKRLSHHLMKSLIAFFGNTPPSRTRRHCRIRFIVVYSLPCSALLLPCRGPIEAHFTTQFSIRLDWRPDHREDSKVYTCTLTVFFDTFTTTVL